MSNNAISNRAAWMAVTVAALGYFVDAYDIVLFSAIRVASLQGIGVAEDKLMSVGAYLLNCQLIGMLIGGVLWGVFGDKKGRIQVLFGSILMYSLANLANAFVTTVDQYAVLRVLAGIGLAGEIGAGITLVSELMPKETRGYGTAIVAAIGVAGGAFAGVIGNITSWQTSYIIGGVMGLALLALRVSVVESGTFEKVKVDTDIQKGSLLMLFNNWDRFKRYTCLIMIGLPLWFVVGVLITFTPEISKALGVNGIVKASTAMIFFALGLSIGDVISGLISQWVKSRKKVIITMITAALCAVLYVLNSHGLSANTYYACMGLIGLCSGYWAILLTTAAEQFGTNLRATVTTSVPNMVRGAAVPMTLSFSAMSQYIGSANSALIVGISASSIAIAALFVLKESFGVDLNFVEKNAANQSDLAETEKSVGNL